MLLNKSITVNANTFNKDPMSSTLGGQLVIEGIYLLSEVGLEEFTFKKLAHKIGSTEASIYRYFSNKHMFLVYISNLYWKWLEQRLRDISFRKISHRERLEEALDVLIDPVSDETDTEFPYQKLVEVISYEGPKVYLTRFKSDDNVEGVFLAFKTLCAELAQFILNLNPDYPFSHSLATTAIRAIQDQLFFSQNLPRLTDIEENNTPKLKEFILNTITASCLT